MTSLANRVIRRRARTCRPRHGPWRRRHRRVFIQFNQSEASGWRCMMTVLSENRS
jgi:hypothetical protein